MDPQEPCHQVSIPFKREGLSERVIFTETKDGVKVSIPFKREGLSERNGNGNNDNNNDHVSIPFKREGLSEL